MESRQQRVLFRDDPPEAWFLVGSTSLRNIPGHVRAAQLRHLLEVAELPNVTVQVVPVESWHPGTSAGFIVGYMVAPVIT